MTQQLTAKSDVYSFGVVMLELITSRLPIEKGKYIVREVRTALNKDDKELCGLRDLIDPVLVKSGSLIGFQRFVELALLCVEDSSYDRPTMNDIVKELEIILKDDEQKVNLAKSASATYVVENNASQQPYDELFLSREVGNSTGVYRSDRCLFSE